METLLVSNKRFTYRDFSPFFKGPVRAVLTKNAERKVVQSYKNLQTALNQKVEVYGVSTGFGNLSNISIL